MIIPTMISETTSFASAISSGDITYPEHTAVRQLYPALPLADHKGSICSYEEVKIFTKSHSEPTNTFRSSVTSIEVLDDCKGNSFEKGDSCNKEDDVTSIISNVKPLPAERKKPVPAPRASSIPHDLSCQTDTGTVTPSVGTLSQLEPTRPSRVTPVSLTNPTVTASEKSIIIESSSPLSPVTPVSRQTIASRGKNNSFDEEPPTDGHQSHLQQQQVSKSVERFGPVGSRQASIKWFKSTQAKFLLQINEGKEKNDAYMDWFHGIITRNEAELLLESRATGSFLVRVGESRLGYTLSLKDTTRCRHYMIEYLHSEESFQVVGENTLHMSLPDLVNFYKKNKIANFEGRLTSACPQNEGECDYLELVITADEEQKLNYICNKPRLEATAPMFDDNFSNNSWSIGPTPLHSRTVVEDSKPPLIPKRDPPTLPQRIAPPIPIIIRKKYAVNEMTASSTSTVTRNNRPVPHTPLQAPPLPPPRAKIR